MSRENIYPSKFKDVGTSLSQLQNQIQHETEYKQSVEKKIEMLNHIKIFLEVNPQLTDLRIAFKYDYHNFDIVSDLIIPTEFEILYNQPNMYCDYRSPNIRLNAYTYIDGIKIRMRLFKIGYIRYDNFETYSNVVLADSGWEKDVLEKCGQNVVDLVNAWISNTANYN